MKKFWLNKTCGIYKITNKLNGMCYVGQSKDVCGRWKSHISSKKSAIGNAIKTEGVESFIFEVLEECTEEELNEREIYWIAHFNCTYPSGYNKTSGGSTNKTITEHTKKKIGKSMTGKALPKSEDTKIKMSEAAKKRWQKLKSLDI